MRDSAGAGLVSCIKDFLNHSVYLCLSCCVENVLLCWSAKCRLMNDSSCISMCILDHFLKLFVSRKDFRTCP